MAASKPDHTPHSFPWLVYGSEFLGTALLVLVGLSIVIIAFGSGSPIIRIIPDPGWRRLITGFLFGTTGALIALSPLGRESGAHINPVVTLAFRFLGKLRTSDAFTYVVAQLTGAVAGALPLLLWGAMGTSIDFGSTVPGTGDSAWLAMAGEVVTTFALVVGLFFFLRHERLRRFTPALFPPLYAIMVYLEAPLSGTSTNPARSLGPAVISGQWHAWWIYWIGPLLGSVAAVLFYRYSWLRSMEIRIAKLYHFGHDRYGVFQHQERDPVGPGGSTDKESSGGAS